NPKTERLDPGVESNVEIVVQLAAGLPAVERDCNGMAAGRKVGPIRLRAVPDNVGLGANTRIAAEKCTSAKGRVPHPKDGHFLDETIEIGVCIRERPVEPTRFIVLAPGVIVPALRA